MWNLEDVVNKTLGPEDRNLWQNEATAYILLPRRDADWRRRQSRDPRFRLPVSRTRPSRTGAAHRTFTLPARDSDF